MARKCDPFRVGDFVCVNSPGMWRNEMYFQAIGRVIEISDNLTYPQHRITFPPHSNIMPISLRKGALRRATAYEGMIAFWDPDAVNKLFFAEDHRLITARAKSTQAALTADDL